MKVSPRQCALHSDAGKQSRDQACTKGIPVWPRCPGGTGTGKEWLLRKGGQRQRGGSGPVKVQTEVGNVWKVDEAHWQKQGGQVLDPVLLRINSVPILGKGEPRDLLGS